MIEPEQTEFFGGSSRSADSAQGREMEVLCACDGQYLPHVATMLCSLLEHNRIYRIHFFYSSVASRQLAKLKSLVARYKSTIVFYEIVPTHFQDLLVDKWASIAVYYRLLAPRLLSADVDKILYLDSDIIVKRSLNNLWNTDITNHALAAASNYGDDARKALGLPSGTKYFNSGVLLINLQFWRQNNVPERAIAFIRNNPEKVQYWDQDALNAILVDQWIDLPASWNAQHSEDWLPGNGNGPAIIHFTGHQKPWHWSSAHPFKHEYHRYRLKTPWRLYLQEGEPRVRSIRSVARVVLPDSLRRWLRSRLMTSKV